MDLIVYWESQKKEPMILKKDQYNPIRRDRRKIFF